MRWLLDNMVPRGVRRPLKDRGDDVIEVRQVLGQEAGDSAIRAYARAQDYVVITHDRELATTARRQQLRHVFLRLRESEDAERIDAVYDAVVASFGAGAIQVVIRANVVLRDP